MSESGFGKKKAAITTGRYVCRHCGFPKPLKYVINSYVNEFIEGAIYQHLWSIQFCNIICTYHYTSLQKISQVFFYDPILKILDPASPETIFSSC